MAAAARDLVDGTGGALDPDADGALDPEAAGCSAAGTGSPRALALPLAAIALLGLRRRHRRPAR
ncbi:MAG TPA: MYXO-CTERM sorting domain-containing protein [Kofleriaceae bacterium]|nr:MYXO-CTERM sorting domain-containing protein [Kofleriaceae bacterium]